MATMNISLPDQMRKFVESRTEQGGYGTASEYFRDLVRADQEQRHRQQLKLEEMLLEGVRSPATEWTPADMDKVRALVKQRLKKIKK